MDGRVTSVKRGFVNKKKFMVQDALSFARVTKTIQNCVTHG